MDLDDTPRPLEYDAMTVAREGLNYLRSLDLQPSRWVIGVKAWIQIVERCTFFSGPPTSDVETQPILMGLPVSVQSNVNPWTVQLDYTEDRLQP